LFLERQFNQFRRLPRIKIVRDPGRLLAFDAALVKLVAGALENVKAMAKLLEFLCELVVDRKRIRRKEEVLFSEEAFGGEGASNRGKLISGGEQVLSFKG
jgi:hypothetical protein